MGHPSDRQQPVGKFSYQRCLSANRQYFQATMMIEMDMHRGDDQFLMVVLNIGQDGLQIAFVMIIDQGDGPGDFLFSTDGLTLDKMSPDHFGQRL